MAITGGIAAITSTASATGDVGTTVEITVTSNFTISNIEVDDDTVLQAVDGKIRPTNNITAGVRTGTISVIGEKGFVASQDVSITLNSVSLVLLPPTNIAASSISQRSFVITFTAAAGATGYEIAIDGQISSVQSITSGQTVNVGTPDRIYGVQLRSTDGTNFSDFSTSLLVRTLADVDPGPDPGITPRRAYEVNAAMCLQGHFNFQAAGSPWGDHVRAGGWMESMYKPMADVGIKRWRNAFGGGPVTTIVRKLYNNHGAKFEATLSDNRVTDTQSPQWMIDYAHDNFFIGGTCIVNSFQGLNEPNNPKNQTHRTNAPRDVVRSCNQWLDRMEFYGGDFAGVRKVSYSPWGRERDQMLRIVYADGKGPWNASATASLAPYTTSDGLTWQDDVLPRLDELNFHYYTGGREPTLAGTPGTVLDENGDPVLEISLDDSLHELRILALSTPDYYAGGEDRKLGMPYSCTEGGWHHQGPGSIDPNLVRDNNWAFVTSAVQAKYTQRAHFEHMLRGVGVNGNGHYVWYEFMDNPSEHGNIYGSISWRSVGGVFEYTPRPFYTTQLNTARAFYDPAGNARTFAVNNLDFSLGNPPNIGGQYGPLIHHLLFQKANGKWLLAMWFDHESWHRNYRGQTPINGTEDFEFRTIRVRFNDGNKTCRSIRPYISNPNNVSNWTQYNSGNATAFVDMEVHDDVTVLEVTPT